MHMFVTLGQVIKDLQYEVRVSQIGWKCALNSSSGPFSNYETGIEVSAASFDSPSNSRKSGQLSPFSEINVPRRAVKSL